MAKKGQSICARGRRTLLQTCIHTLGSSLICQTLRATCRGHCIFGALLPFPWSQYPGIYSAMYLFPLPVQVPCGSQLHLPPGMRPVYLANQYISFFSHQDCSGMDWLPNQGFEAREDVWERRERKLSSGFERDTRRYAVSSCWS